MNSFEELRQAYIAGEFTKNSNLVSADRLSEFPEEDIVDFANLPGGQEGIALLREGRWARLVLNGGMATRFGGKVKGICEVYDGKTFVELKLDHTTRLEQELDIPEIPVAFMNSPATHQLTLDFLEKNNYFGRKKITTFVQVDAPRLTCEGKIFQHSKGKDRAPRGHGDFMWALKESGTFDLWLAQGVSHFDFSNIDNLGSTVEPILVSSFVTSQKSMGIELVRKNLGDAGGAAGLKDGVKGVIEGIYFDETFDQSRLTFFSPNNLMFEIKKLQSLMEDATFTLPWNVVIKKVDGQEVVQFERIAIDSVFAFNQQPEDNNVIFYSVPREGPQGRFYPIKSPQDLEDSREKLKERLK